MMDVRRSFAIVVATFFGAGKFRYASGTAGSLAALPVIWLIHSTLGNSAVVIFAVLLFFLGIWASRVYIDISGDKDPKPVVIDEVARARPAQSSSLYEFRGGCASICEKNVASVNP